MITDITTDTDLITTIDLRQTPQSMIAAGKYDSINSNITGVTFPVEGTGTKNFRNRLFYFGRYISSEDAVAAMKKEGFEPATQVHGLAFGAAVPDEQGKYPIACLGSSAEVDGRRVVVYLGMCNAERCLDLYYWAIGWRGYWRFLAVQEVSDA